MLFLKIILTTIFGTFHKLKLMFFFFLCRLVVGAPKFDTSSYQLGVQEAGAVFKCSMNDGDCSLVKFDSSGKLSFDTQFQNQT